MRSGKHGNNYLQNAFKKNGENSFEFSVVEYCSRENLISREQYYIDLIGLKNLYNISPKAGSRLGTKCNAETRTRISKANKGRKHSDDTRTRISNALTGKKASVKARANMSKAQKGNTNNLGRYPSEATRAKIRETLTGKKHSPERAALCQKPVQQLDRVSGKVIATFNSTVIASQETKINRGNISSCCCGERKSAGGFCWRYT